MWEYKIYKTDLGYGIYKKREKNWIIQLWFLCAENKRKLDKRSARTFYHKEDAESALVIIKTKDKKDAD